MDINSLILSLSLHPAIISFLAGFLAGEAVIVPLAFMSGSGLFPLWIVFVFAYLGVVLADILWFGLGRLNVVHRLHRLEKFSRMYGRVDKYIEEASNRSVFRVIFYSKFLYGTRIATLIYLGLKKAHATVVVKSIVIVHLIFLSVIVVVGWLAGKGLALAGGMYEHGLIAITIIVAIIVALPILRKIIGGRIAHKEEMHRET